MIPEARAAERYALLVRQIGEELSYRRGWQTSAAARLGVHRSYVTRLVSGTLGSIGSEVIRRAVAAAPASASPAPAAAIFGERLATLMDAAGIRTKREFMDQVGISAMTLRRYEFGEREPSASTIVAMTKALGCSADVLLGLDTPEAETIRAVVRSEVRAEVRSALSDVLTAMARAAERGAL